MHITEKDLKQYFPKDRRFLHYCAKRYGLSFPNDEIVELANHKALLAVMKMYNDKKEFEDEAMKIGYVMKAFNYAILNSYKRSETTKSVSCISESDLYTDDEGEPYNAFSNAEDESVKEYTGMVEFYREVIRTQMGDRCLFVLDNTILNYNLTAKEVAKELELHEDSVRTIKRRVTSKLREVAKKEENSIKNEISVENERKASEAISKCVLREIRGKAIEEEQKKRERLSKAMSFVYS